VKFTPSQTTTLLRRSKDWVSLSRGRSGFVCLFFFFRFVKKTEAGEDAKRNSLVVVRFAPRTVVPNSRFVSADVSCRRQISRTLFRTAGSRVPCSCSSFSYFFIFVDFKFVLFCRREDSKHSLLTTARPMLRGAFTSAQRSFINWIIGNE
jgi:hypothetical protein